MGKTAEEKTIVVKFTPSDAKKLVATLKEIDTAAVTATANADETIEKKAFAKQIAGDIEEKITEQEAASKPKAEDAKQEAPSA